MKVTLLTLVLSSLASLAAAADETLPSYCLDGTASAEFFQCSILNSNSCASCDSNNNTEPTGFFDCATLNEEFCPLIKCCAACEMETQRFYECNVLPLTALFNPTAATCSFDCSGFTSPPTLPPADQEPASPCDAETASWVVCALTQGDQCLGCTNSTYDPSLLALAGQDDCSLANSYFCATLGCCSSCQAELTALYQCSISQDLASCELSCTPTPVTPVAPVAPVAPVTLAPAGSPLETQCAAEGAKWLACLATQGSSCSSCEAITENTAATPDSAVVGQDECTIANLYLCPLLGCCSSCQTELTELYLCGSQDDISSCDLSCSSAPAVSVAPVMPSPVGVPTIVTTSAPVVVVATTSAPVTSAPAAVTTPTPATLAPAVPELAPTPLVPVTPAPAGPVTTAPAVVPTTKAPIASGANHIVLMIVALIPILAAIMAF